MATHTKKTKIAMDAAGGSSYAPMGSVKTVRPPSPTKGSAESTTLESTGDAKEFQPGWIDNGEAGFVVRTDKVQYNTILTAFNSSDVQTFKIEMPLLSGESTASNWTFAGFFTSVGQTEADSETDAVFDTDCTIKITGPVLFTPGAA